MTQEIETRPRDPLERSRAVGTALSVAARKARMSNQTRLSLYKTVGLRPRMSDRIFGVLAKLTFVTAFVLPVLAAIAYYGFIASDQYQSETRFTVRTSAPIKGKDKLTAASGIPSAKIVQDTQIITNNIETPALVEWLDEEVGLREIYSDPSIDWFARLDPDASREELVEYWNDMTDTEVELPGGIVVISVRAFAARDAQMILEAIVRRSEELVNVQNDRIITDVKDQALRALESSRGRLEETRLALQEQQNSAGVFDVQQEAENLGELIVEVQTEFLELDARYQTNLASVSDDAPQMRVLRRELLAKRDQLDALKARLARATGTDSGEVRSLADFNEQATRLEFERGVAEELLEEAVKRHERVRVIQATQLMYVDPFLAPTLPETAEYPRRILMIAIVTVLAFLAWTFSGVVIGKLRTRFD